MLSPIATAGSAGVRALVQAADPVEALLDTPDDNLTGGSVAPTVPPSVDLAVDPSPHRSASVDSDVAPGAQLALLAAQMPAGLTLAAGQCRSPDTVAGGNVVVDSRPDRVYVQAGDSLSKIAARFPEHGSINDLKQLLIAANPQLRDPNALREGMTLSFPRAGTVVDQSAINRAADADARYRAALAAPPDEPSGDTVDGNTPAWNMRDASAAIMSRVARAADTETRFQTLTDHELHAAGYQTARASDPADAARLALERQRAITAIGIAAGGPVLSGLASGARLSGAPDQVVNHIGMAQAGLVMSLAATLASHAAVVAKPVDQRFDPSIEGFINIGKQSRHTLGTREYERLGGGKSYFRQLSDAQDVLSAYQSGQTVVVGRGSDGGPIIRFDAVVGFNHNPGAGFPNQPTNIFWIKGSSSVSVVPMSPTKGQ